VIYFHFYVLVWTEFVFFICRDQMTFTVIVLKIWCSIGVSCFRIISLLCVLCCSGILSVSWHKMIVGPSHRSYVSGRIIFNCDSIINLISIFRNKFSWIAVSLFNRLWSKNTFCINKINIFLSIWSAKLCLFTSSTSFIRILWSVPRRITVCKIKIGKFFLNSMETFLWTFSLE